MPAELLPVRSRQASHNHFIVTRQLSYLTTDQEVVSKPHLIKPNKNAAPCAYSFPSHSAFILLPSVVVYFLKCGGGVIDIKVFYNG
jgi:hypothetical protein